MRVQARLFPLGEASQKILSSLLPANAIPTSGRYPMDVEDPLLERILEEGERSNGFWVGGESVYSMADLCACTHFEAVCRKIVRESRQDFAANDALRARTPLRFAGGAEPIRLLAGVSLTRIPLKPNMVGSVGEWTQEYVLGAGVVKAFRDAEFTGAAFLPVTNPRTGTAHERFAHLFTESLLPTAVMDESVERIRSQFKEEDGALRHLGCLGYDPAALVGRADFNRSAEPWGGSHGWPSWVVSARVMEVFKTARLRGWHFRPVLTRGSDIYAQYLERWRRLRSLVAGTRKSLMDGGRW
jgi:hypothetical protein